MNEIAALFDMDHTLIWKNTGLSSLQYSYRLGLVPLGFVAQGIVNIALYRLSLLDIEQWYERNMSLLTGISLNDMERFGRQWFETSVRHTIYRDSVRLVERHRSEGHRLVVISNSPPFFVQPVAEAVGIAEIVTTGVETREGILTGRLLRPLCYGKGKRDIAFQWARSNGVDLATSYFYTDSFYDVHLMREVGHPVAVNPDRRLRRVAAAMGWEILDFRRISAFPRCTG